MIIIYSSEKYDCIFAIGSLDFKGLITVILTIHWILCR